MALSVCEWRITVRGRAFPLVTLYLSVYAVASGLNGNTMNSDLRSADEPPDRGSRLIWMSNAISMQVLRCVVVLTVHNQRSPVLDEEVLLAVRDQLGALKSDQPWNAVFDLGGVPIFGSSMWGLMLTVRKFANATGGQMAVCNVSDVAREKMDQLSLSGLWLIKNSLHDAVNAVVDQTL